MDRLAKIVLLFALTIAPSLASPLLFQGTFSVDTQVAVFTITANSSELITIQTYSYAGGTVNSTTIPAGGFAPTAFLFDNSGEIGQLFNDSSCTQVGTDPTTGNCDDLYYTNTLGPGTYTLALAVYNNTPVDNVTPYDGFVQQTPGFTCSLANSGNGTGSFCDDTTSTPSAFSRTDSYSIGFINADSVVFDGFVPEPNSLLLLLAGGAIFAALRRRRISA